MDCCREARIRFSVGYDLTETIRDAMLEVPDDAWVAAQDQDGSQRPNGQVCEITDQLQLTSWPVGSRVLLRRERVHPGAQLTFTDHDGHRFQAILTDQPAADIAASPSACATACCMSLPDSPCTPAPQSCACKLLGLVRRARRRVQPPQSAARARLTSPTATATTAPPSAPRAPAKPAPDRAFNAHRAPAEAPHARQHDADGSHITDNTDIRSTTTPPRDLVHDRG